MYTNYQTYCIREFQCVIALLESTNILSLRRDSSLFEEHRMSTRFSYVVAKYFHLLAPLDKKVAHLLVHSGPLKIMTHQEQWK